MLFVKRHSIFDRVHLMKDLTLIEKIATLNVKRQPHSEETKRKIGLANKGKPKSAEHRKKLSEIKQKAVIEGRFKSPCYWKDKKMPKLMRDKLSLNAAKRIELNGKATIGKNETKILDYAETVFGYKIQRQVRIGKYFVDGYIPEIHMVIEIDEERNHKDIIKDWHRELEIRSLIGCNEFIRISEERGLNAINQI